MSGIPKEAFTALGECVKAFEDFVDMLRFQIAFMMRSPPWQTDFLSLFLHHRVMTAQPLFDIYRAMAWRVIHEDGVGLNEEERKIAIAVLKQITSDADQVISKRNDYVHGSWGIYSGSSDQAVEEIPIIIKRKLNSKAGWKFEIPNLKDLRTYRNKCEEIRDFISTIPPMGQKATFDKYPQLLPSSLFEKKGRRWVRKTP